MGVTPLHIVNAQLIDGDTPRPGSLLAVDGRIAEIDPTELPERTETVDAKGQWLAPGIIDLGVFATDKPAFHFGGITRAALMPDAGRLDDPGLVERAAKGGKPDLWVHPVAAATKGLAGKELAEIGMMKGAGARAIATGRARIADSGVMRRILSYAASLSLVTIIHAEDEGLTAGAVATDGEMATRLGLASAPAIAESMAIARYLMIVEETGAPLHFRQFPAGEPLGRGGERMNPQVGLAALRRALDQPHIVERPGIGHQRCARDAAEMKGRLVGREDAEVDDAGREPLPLRIDRLAAVGRLAGVQRRDAAHDVEQAAAFAARQARVPDQ